MPACLELALKPDTTTLETLWPEAEFTIEHEEGPSKGCYPIRLGDHQAKMIYSRAGEHVISLMTPEC